jgi:hypothetical protein
MFDQVLPDRSDDPGAVQVITSTNVNSFAYGESPRFEVTATPDIPQPVSEAIYIRGAVGEDSLYRSTWTVFTDQPKELAPVVRMRSSAWDFRQSDALVSTSIGDGSYSPTSPSMTYVQYFSQPEGQNSFRLDFDVLNVDPSDTANATVSLDTVMVEALNQADLTSGSMTLAYDFTSQATNGWIELPAEPIITKPETYAATDEGLLIRGLEPEANRQWEYYPAEIFGYWGLTTNQAINGNTLYCIRWTVTSDADSENYDELPVIRLRVNDTSLKFSAFTNIDSVNDTVVGPYAGNPKTYELWFQTPDEISGSNFIFSFDYLYVDKPDDSIDQDNPELATILRGIEVYEYAVPAGTPLP